MSSWRLLFAALQSVCTATSGVLQGPIVRQLKGADRLSKRVLRESSHLVGERRQHAPRLLIQLHGDGPSKSRPLCVHKCGPGVGSSAGNTSFKSPSLSQAGAATLLVTCHETRYPAESTQINALVYANLSHIRTCNNKPSLLRVVVTYLPHATSHGFP